MYRIYISSFHEVFHSCIIEVLVCDNAEFVARQLTALARLAPEPEREAS
jgi:hypothetical protein